MAKLLDASQADTVADLILEALDIAGYEVYEAIPGLVKAIHMMSEKWADTIYIQDQFLDEASDLLADGVGDE